MVSAEAERRANGKTAGQDEAAEQAKELTKLVEEEKESPVSLTRAFQRLRTDWTSKDADVIASIKSIVEQKLFNDFTDAYRIIYKLDDIVRKKEFDPNTGEIKVDRNGLAVWAKTPDGAYIEDWSLITHKHRSDLIHQITTRMFDWEQRAADAWGEALFAKANWEEAFATAYDTTPSGTVEARTAHANRVVADNRYLAVFKSYYSKKAEALVNSLDRCCQRLKDLTV
jgi:hypothetical protein